MTDQHETYMRRALELAELGKGDVSPNPLVGCVIVHEGRIIGEGYHEKYGGPHAEPNAIREVNDKSLLAASTLYVTLEPCAHFGKTPPCAHLLAEHKIKQVLIAAVDSNPLVGGKGIEILKKAGVEVVTGVLEKEARWQNRRFFTVMEKERPYIILKWAQTRDGYVARPDYDSKWISNAHSRQLVHRWRAEEAAIMVGTKTAFYDNPRLNVRDWTGRDPLRVFIDKKLTLDTGMHLFDGTQPTICYNTVREEERGNLNYVKLQEDFSIYDILADLHVRKIQSLIVEGGTVLLQHFIANDLWDEVRVFTGNIAFGHGIPAPRMHVIPSQTLDLMGDRLDIYWSN